MDLGEMITYLPHAYSLILFIPYIYIYINTILKL